MTQNNNEGASPAAAEAAVPAPEGTPEQPQPQSRSAGPLLFRTDLTKEQVLNEFNLALNHVLFAAVSGLLSLQQDVGGAFFVNLAVPSTAPEPEVEVGQPAVKNLCCVIAHGDVAKKIQALYAEAGMAAQATDLTLDPVNMTETAEGAAERAADPAPSIIHS